MCSSIAEQLIISDFSEKLVSLSNCYSLLNFSARSIFSFYSCSYISAFSSIFPVIIMGLIQSWKSSRPLVAQTRHFCTYGAYLCNPGIGSLKLFYGFAISNFLPYFLVIFSYFLKEILTCLYIARASFLVTTPFGQRCFILIGLLETKFSIISFPSFLS